MRRTIPKAALFAISALFCFPSTVTPAGAQETGILIPFDTLARQRNSNIWQPKNAVVTNAQDWQKLWRKTGGLAMSAPQIDFSQHTVIAVFNGTAGDANNLIEIVRVVKIGKLYRVFATENHTHMTCPPPPPVSSNSIHFIVIEKVKNPERRVEFMAHEHQSIPCR